MKVLALAALLFAAPVFGQASPDPWKELAFLEGTWEANTQGGTAGAKGSATYTFQPQLGHHVLARLSGSYADCKGPVTFDCQHSDLLYVYQDAANQPLKAIYFDNEGHVIHYDVSSPEPNVALFLSDASVLGPQFRLVYALKNGSMSGKFQMRMPGQSEWKSYLEWSGPKR